MVWGLYWRLTGHHLDSGMLIRCCRVSIRSRSDRTLNYEPHGCCCLSSKATSSGKSMVEASPDSDVFADLSGEYIVRRRDFFPIPVNSHSGLS